MINIKDDEHVAENNEDFSEFLILCALQNVFVRSCSVSLLCLYKETKHKREQETAKQLAH